MMSSAWSLTTHVHVCYLPQAIPLPATGLMVDIAYRWDVVCDFTGYENQVRRQCSGGNLGVAMRLSCCAALK